MAPHATQSGQNVLELRKLNLETPLSRGCVHTKYVEDKRGSVDDLNRLPHNLLEVRLLRRRELVIKYHYVSIEVVHVGDKLFDFALANEGAGDRRFEPLRKREHHIGAVRLRKTGELPH